MRLRNLIKTTLRKFVIMERFCHARLKSLIKIAPKFSSKNQSLSLPASLASFTIKTFVLAEELLYNLFMSQFFIDNSDVILKLILALALGMLIGAERILVHKEAGMKTHALVSLGSALFILISEMIAIKYGGINTFDPSRIASQVIVGIGFLGAGSIILQGNRLLGLTTAGGLWVTAGIGMAAGFGFYDLAIISTILVLLVLIVVNIFEKPMRVMAESMEKKNFN